MEADKHFLSNHMMSILNSVCYAPKKFAHSAHRILYVTACLFCMLSMHTPTYNMSYEYRFLCIPMPFHLQRQKSSKISK
jgi:hypothetical protein